MATRKSPTSVVDDSDVLSVHQFAALVNESLQVVFAGGVWVEGEIEKINNWNGHQFIEIIDGGKNDRIKLDCTLWQSSAVRVKKKLDGHGIALKTGMRIRFFGIPNLKKNSSLSLIVSDVDAQFAVGDIAKKREELIKRLEDSGMTKRNKMREVPLVPLRLGVVSSASAAGWADAKKHLTESGFGFTVLFRDVTVQGTSAPPQIANAITSLGKRDDVDVILVMRGGGSKSDLAAFDEEAVAMAIVKCSKPVFVGVGHEIDVSVADIVAHTTCKTPTACADEVIGYVADFVESVDSLARSVRLRTQSALTLARSTLARHADRVQHRAQAIFTHHHNLMNNAETKVKLLDPVTVMSRGWSITRDKNGNVLRTVSDITVGDTLTTYLADGSVVSTANEVQK
jgi:exodeoxyribonuclease VII large subunit